KGSIISTVDLPTTEIIEPDIFPISLLLLTDERPLATELLVTRMKTIAPFVETIQVKASSQYDAKDKEYYDSVLSTKVLHNDDIKMISIYPDAKELLPLQEYLQNVQVHREVRVREQIIRTPQYDFQKYLLASQMLLSRFAYQNIDNPKLFVETVPTLIDYHEIIISRFENPFIVDDVNRIDRTPILKLGYDEGFIRPIRELKERQLSYQNLLKTIAFVFNYNDSNDEQSVQLQEFLATKPLPEVVADVTGLTDQDLISEIVDSTENL
ncbi:mannitol dehydrogenase family protein, partial [Streptococcus macedonicus]